MKKITKKQYQIWKKILSEIPVSINNYYGDPTIQWEDTLNKLRELLKEKHTGPIGIITKGKITEKMAQQLKEFSELGLNIVVLVSISELVNFEKIPQKHRYENIKTLNNYGIKNIAYVRPMTPPYNTDKKTIQKICKKCYRNGTKTIVVSGFRGDNNIIEDMNPQKVVEWTLRVKLMTKDVYKEFKKNCEKYKIQMFTRTSCAISYLCGHKYTYNPYYNSPNLVKCTDLNCPLVSTCKAPQKPKYGSLSLLKFLGFNVKFISEPNCQMCYVQADKRLKCLSCCTTCYMLKNTRIISKNPINLGGLTFMRFISGIIAMRPNVRDTGDLDIANVTLPNFKMINSIQCLNSWWPYAHIGKTCFGCKYCIEKYYGTTRKNFGFPPTKLIDKIIKFYNIKIS